jgi:hypothetical protein
MLGNAHFVFKWYISCSYLYCYTSHRVTSDDILWAHFVVLGGVRSSSWRLGHPSTFIHCSAFHILFTDTCSSTVFWKLQIPSELPGYAASAFTAYILRSRIRSLLRSLVGVRWSWFSQHLYKVVLKWSIRLFSATCKTTCVAVALYSSGNNKYKVCIVDASIPCGCRPATSSTSYALFVPQVSTATRHV